MESQKELYRYIDLLIERYPILSECKESVFFAYKVLENCFSSGHKLLIAGNGGSCADADHIVGELMKGFKLSRRCAPSFMEKMKSIDPVRGEELASKLQQGLPAIALQSHQALNTAFTNDVENGGLLTFAQQVYVYGKEGDVFLGISTSGNAKNIVYASVVARTKGVKIVGLTGKSGGELALVSDVSIKVPLSETYMIQELHLPIYHCLCLMLEERFFG